MTVKWTDEQRKAIETTDRGVVVPAAAGSGKTAVLIERTVRLLSDKSADCPAETLLAVTFTKDAANQMRNKLRAALAERLAGETDSEKRDWLERQQEMLPLAKISTINSFCLELVKDNLNEFDYRSGMKIADEMQAQTLLDEAAEQAMEEMRAEAPERAELLIDALTNNSEKELAKYLRDMHRFICSLAFPEEWLNEAERGFTDPERMEDFVQALVYEFEIYIERAFKSNERAAFIAARIPNNEKLLSVLGDDLEIIEAVKAALLSGDYGVLYNSLESVKYPVMRKPSDKGLDDEQRIAQENAFEQLKLQREKVKKNLRSIQNELGQLGSDIYTPMKYAGMVFGALREAVGKLGRILSERKVESGLAEFNDVERMAMELLIAKENGEPVRTELARRINESRAYRVLLIDEYQDVNNLQEMIFRALSDSDSLDALGRNVFVVGDVKQSIYRFRLSNPRLFLNAVKSAQDEKNTDLEMIRLTRNFRSRKNVIDLVNRVFTQLMSEELGELEYGGGERLRCGAVYGGNDKPAELMLIEDSEEIDDELKYVTFGVEELSVARHIKERIISGEQTFRGDEPKVCRPEDFCVLTRGREGCRRISAALEYVGLKAQSEQTQGYMGSREIITMVNLLRVIDNPMKDLPMASVMMSPIMSFTAEETARLRLLCRASGDDEPKRMYQIILAVSKDEDADIKEAEKIDVGDSLLEDKCRSAAGLIRRLRFYSVSMSLEALISKIYDETGFFAVASAFENSKQKRANLRLLTQRAAEYEKDSTGGIAGFLRYLDSVTASGGDFSQALTTNSGAGSVAVKTIHSSKGLEYPFVYLCGLGKGFNLSDTKDRLLMNEQMGVGINYMRHDKLMKVKTLAHKAMETVVKNETLSEELRLLYVALTRAGEQLVIALYLKEHRLPQYDMKKKLSALADQIHEAGGASPAVLRGCNSYLEWIAAAVMLSDFNAPLLEALGREELARDLAMYGACFEDKPQVTWGIYPQTTSEREASKTFAAPAADLREVSRLREKYEFRYPNDSARAASKRTVTEIVSELRRRAEGDADPLFYPQLGSLNAEAARLTAAQRGTFTHLFMELADYSAAERSVKDELDRLTAQGMFTEREAKGVYVSAVEAFFASGLYKRMKKSDELRREMKFMVQAGDAGISRDPRFKDMIADDGMLQGVCDCIFLEDDGYVLVDYKTDGFTDISELDKYGVQLELYKAALDLILPRPVKTCCIYSFRLSAEKEIKLTKE